MKGEKRYVCPPDRFLKLPLEAKKSSSKEIIKIFKKRALLMLVNPLWF
jgi:hypothetical protein